MWIWDPPEPQKVGFRARGVLILTNPPNPLKVTKKAPKRLQNELKMEPLGPTSPSKILRNQQKTKKQKDTQKRPKNKPGMTWEREARL